MQQELIVKLLLSQIPSKQKFLFLNSYCSLYCSDSNRVTEMIGTPPPPAKEVGSTQATYSMLLFRATQLLGLYSSPLVGLIRTLTKRP